MLFETTKKITEIWVQKLKTNGKDAQELNSSNDNSELKKGIQQRKQD